MPNPAIEHENDERTCCEVWVNEDRSSGERAQPSERPAWMPGRTVAPGTGPDAPLPDDERTRCEVWTRVMGYHRPVSAWNPGKQSEHAERRYFVEPGSPGETVTGR